jgi:hypothetical protein
MWISRYRDISVLNNKSCLLAVMGEFRQAPLVNVSMQSNLSTIRTTGYLNIRYSVSDSVNQDFVTIEATNRQPLLVLVFSNLPHFEVSHFGRQVWLYTHVDGIEALTIFFIMCQE